MTDARPKRSLPRRIVRWLVFLVLGVIALAGGLLCFLQTPWGKDLVRTRIEAKLGARLNGSLHIGSVDYSWLFHDLELRDVVIRDAAGQPALAVGTLQATIDRGSLIAKAPVVEELAITGLDVTTARLHGIAKPTTDKPRPLASIAIEHLSVSGAITIEKPDGTKISVRDLALAGSVHARPAAQEVDLVLRDLGAKATIARPGYAPRDITVSIPSISVGKHADGVDLELGPLTAGVVNIAKVGAHLRLAGKKLVGAQTITLGGLHVENGQLAALLGRDLLRDDATVDVSITGPVDKLVVDGDIQTGPSHLALDGTLDLTNAAVPRYDLAVHGTELRSDVVVLPPGKQVPPVSTSVKATFVGSGITVGAIDAKLGLQVGPTTIGDVTVDDLTLDATTDHGAIHLDRLHLRGPGIELDGSGNLAASRALDGAVTLHATPPQIIETLAKYGIIVRHPAALPPRLDLAVDAHGRLDGELAVTIKPTQVALARGTVTVAGTARLDNKKLSTADMKVDLRGLDLATLSRLAGKPPRVAGSLSGSLHLVKTEAARQATYDVHVALPTLGLGVSASGTANDRRVVAAVRASRARDHVVLATVKAEVPLTRRGAKPTLDPGGALAVRLDAPSRALSEIAELLPARLRGKVPATGEVELHVDLHGTAAHPSGTIDLAARAIAFKGETQRVALHADISPAGGLTIAPKASIWLRDEATPIATLDGAVHTVAPFAGGKLDAKALRAHATLDLVLSLPRREMTELAWLRPPLAKLGGALDGTIAVTGTPVAPVLSAAVTVHDVPTADGATHDIAVAAKGSPKKVDATIKVADALTISAQVDHSVATRTEIEAHVDAAKVPLRTLLPAFVAPRLGPHAPGSLDSALAAHVVLLKEGVGIKVDQLAVTGTLDVRGGEILIPDTERRWRDITLGIAAEPAGVRLRTLELHESDREVADRAIHVSGFVALDRIKPQTVTISLQSSKWLVSGTKTLGKHDAPRATLDADIALAVDLRNPTLAIDATVNALALKMPERFDRAHQYEDASLGGDILYTPGGAGAGVLPHAAAPEAPEHVTSVADSQAAVPAQKHRRPIDVHVHIPHPTRVQQPPLELQAEGDLDVKVRDEGVTTRGSLGFVGGKISLMGHDYRLLHGSFAFTDEHPHGWLDATFEYVLPDRIARDLSAASAGGGARITLQGPPANPKRMLNGANNAGLVEAMAINTTGHPGATSAPDLPASEAINLTRQEQLQVLSFMAANLPRLLFLDRMTAWSDPHGQHGVYGRIENAEAERYTADETARVRVVARPPTPGRSTAELQVDRLLLHSAHTAAGIGLRAGDRAGGGVGLFLEWSSD